MKMARGTLYLMIAEVMFVLSGWAIHIVAGRILGKYFYGVFVLLLTLLTQYRIFLASGVHRAVAKYISEDPRFAPAVRRQALRLQFIAGWALCGLVWVIAPSLARLWQNAELVGYIRLTGFFFPIFGLYSVYRGVLNGMKLFGREALVSIVYSLLKVLFLFVLIHYYGIAGAVTGYLVAIVGGMFLARFLAPSGSGETGAPFPIMRIVRFAVPVMLFSFIISLIQNIDLYFIRALIPPPGTDSANSYYGCAQQFSKIPYMILFALSMTLFPNISSLTARPGGKQKAAQTIRKSLRAGLLLVLPVSCLIGGASSNLIEWVFPTINGGGDALRVLIFGQTLLSFLFILTTILTAAGRPWLSFSLVGVTLGIDVILNYLLIPAYGITGAAAATTISSAVGAIAAAGAVRRNFRALVVPSSAVKITIASAIVFWLTLLINPARWMIPPVFLLLWAIYILLLLVFREIDKNDWQMLKSLIIKKAS